MRRWSEAGCSSMGNSFLRPDFLFPSTMNEDGPSASTFFHGGETARDEGRLDLEMESCLRFLLAASTAFWASLLDSGSPFRAAVSFAACERVPFVAFARLTPFVRAGESVVAIEASLSRCCSTTSPSGISRSSESCLPQRPRGTQRRHGEGG